MTTMDALLKKVGDFGRYQKWLFFLLCLPAVTNGCYIMLVIFLAYTPKHRCKIPGYENDTYALQGDYHKSVVDMTIPASSSDILTYDRCNIYSELNGSLWSGYENANGTLIWNTTLTTLSKCKKWVFDKSTFDETITTEDNLVCDEGMKPAHAQVVFYLGILTGDLFFGAMSDYIGRRKTLIISNFVLVGSSLGIAFAPEFYTFTIFEFLAGCGDHGVFVLVCVMAVELIGPGWRMFTGMAIHLAVSVGLFYLAGAGYLLRNWRHVQLVVCVPCVLYFSYWWLMPESPRWLVSQGRYKEAELVLRHIAKRNKVELEEKSLHLESIVMPGKQGRLWHLFSNRTLCLRTLIIFFNWFTVSMVYFGVTIHMGSLGGDFYFKFLLLAIVEIPAIGGSILVLNRWGRRPVHAGFMMFAGVSCVLTIFTVLYGGKKFEPMTLSLCVLGKLGSCACFSIIYVYSSELFPTCVRNGGMGASSCVARLGGMSAPYIAKLGDVIGGSIGLALPLVVFGVFAIIAAVITFFLPETLNKRLPDSIQEGTQFGKNDDLEMDTSIPRASSTTSISSEKEKLNLLPKETLNYN